MKSRLFARRLPLGLVAVLGLSLLVACGGDDEPAQAGGPVPLTFVKCGTMNPGTTADASVPVQMGYWKAENIDVDLPAVNGSAECVQGIDAGTFEVAAIGATSVLIAMAAGAKMKAIAAYVNAQIWHTYVVEGSPIQSVQDLKGKTIGVPALESGAVPMLGALLETGGLTADDVEIVAAGTGAEVVPLLQSGRIDAYAASSSHAVQIDPVLPLRAVSTSEYDSIGFHIPIIASDDVVAEKRQALVGLLRGIFKAIVFAQANPEAAVAMHYKTWPDTKPTGKTNEEIIASGVNSLNARLAEFEAVDGKWGNTNPAVQIKSHLSLLVKQGSVKLDAGAVDEFIGKMWDPALLDEANDFDAEAVKTAAKATKWQDFMP